MQVRLRNNTGRKVTDGELVRLFPGTTDSFIVAKLSEFGIIGTVSGTILTGQVGNINLINTVEYSKLTGIPVEFTPEAHVHNYLDIENHPDFYTKEEIQSIGSDIGIVVDGGASVLTTGIKGYRHIPCGINIIGWTIISDLVGSCIVDIKKTTYGTFPTSVSIAGSEKPTLSGTQKNQLLILTTWTTAFVLDDIIEFNIESVATIKKLHLYIHLTHT